MVMPIHVCLILVRSFATCTCSFCGTREAPGTCRCSHRGETCLELPECFPVQCHPISERTLLCSEFPWLRPLVLLIIALKRRWYGDTDKGTPKYCPLVNGVKDSVPTSLGTLSKLQRPIGESCWLALSHFHAKSAARHTVLGKVHSF
jgi:hypothetical protein